ncbi:MAG: universal stress protein [Halanaerobiales bacterium]|nr:universal stress protein [Halanaerobiales bacterium]
MDKLLLAVDGSESSKKAVEKTVEFNKSLDLEVTIITVLDTSTIELSELQAYRNEDSLEKLIKKNEKELELKGQKILNEAASLFNDSNIKIKNVIEYDNDPAEKICNYAEENNFDLIVLADKGLGAVKRFFLGSISDKVVRHANTSVLVVK